jgi:Ca2+/Na+ antiporter
MFDLMFWVLLAFFVLVVVFTVLLTRYFTMKNMNTRLLICDEPSRNYNFKLQSTYLVYLFILNITGWLALLVMVSERVLNVG